MKISIIIPFKNEWDELSGVLEHLIRTGVEDYSLMEIIVVNDGSVWGSGKFRPIDGIDHPSVRVLNFPRSMGVGASFDRGVENSTSDIIVLQGCDVFAHEGWYRKVIEAVTNNPNTLGCATCVGLNPTRMSLDDPKNFRRYGADLLFYVTEEDLPKESALRDRKGGYTALFKAKWLDGKQSDEPYEIPCLLGAFYFTSRAYYNALGGFDTVKGNKYQGHAHWGSLEPYISLKSWFVGGGCILYPSIEAGHVFSRINVHNRLSKGGRGADWIWWNMLFILETMILTPSLPANG
jgi:glycosyltransferase involved in cell wall biosynthesis